MVDGYNLLWGLQRLGHFLSPVFHKSTVVIFHGLELRVCVGILLLFDWWDTGSDLVKLAFKELWETTCFLSDMTKTVVQHHPWNSKTVPELKFGRPQLRVQSLCTCRLFLPVQMLFFLFLYWKVCSDQHILIYNFEGVDWIDCWIMDKRACLHTPQFTSECSLRCYTRNMCWQSDLGVNWCLNYSTHLTPI